LVGVAKPDPAIFVLATRRLGLPPAIVWYVGDSLNNNNTAEARMRVASAPAAPTSPPE
jgi:FMN phosphatase YigB (HAD superfamily)